MNFIFNIGEHFVFKKNGRRNDRRCGLFRRNRIEMRLIFASKNRMNKSKSLSKRLPLISYFVKDKSISLLYEIFVTKKKKCRRRWKNRVRKLARRSIWRENRSPYERLICQISLVNSANGLKRRMGILNQINQSGACIF